MTHFVPGEMVRYIVGARSVHAEVVEVRGDAVLIELNHSQLDVPFVTWVPTSRLVQDSYSGQELEFDNRQGVREQNPHTVEDSAIYRNSPCAGVRSECTVHIVK